MTNPRVLPALLLAACIEFPVDDKPDRPSDTSTVVTGSGTTSTGTLPTGTTTTTPVDIGMAWPLAVRTEASNDNMAYAAWFTEDSGVATTDLYVVNVGTGPQTISVTARDDSGQSLGLEYDTIVPGATWHLNSAGLVGSAATGSLSIESTEPTLTGLAMHAHVTLLDAGSPAAVIPVSIRSRASSDAAAYGPVFRDEVGATLTRIAILNTLSVGQDVTVEFFDDAGAPLASVPTTLAPENTWRIDTASVAGLGGTQGTFRVTSDAGTIAGLALQAEVVTLDAAGEIDHVAPITLRTETSTEFAAYGASYQHVPDEAVTRLSVLNTNTTAVTATASFRDPAGFESASTYQTLSPGERWALDTAQLGLGDPAGWFELDSTHDMSSLAVHAEVATLDAGVERYVVPVPLAIARSSDNRAWGAHFAHEDGVVNTIIRIVNTGSSPQSVGVDFYDPTGTVAGSASYQTITAGEQMEVDTASVGGLGTAGGSFEVWTTAATVGELTIAASARRLPSP